MALSRTQRQAIIARAKGRCELCRNAPATEVDHIWPQSKGGTDDPSNLQAACHDCNHRKRATVPDGMLPLFVGPYRQPNPRQVGRRPTIREQAHAGHEACACDFVGQAQIADRLGVQRKTANRWRLRGVLPATEWQVGRDPAWCWPHTIVPWAVATRRLAVEA